MDPAAAPDPVPRRGNAFSEWLGRLGLRALRWRIEGALPPVPRCVLVVAPHTSNWDFAVGVFTMLALRLRVSWLGKQSLFRFPVNAFLRFLGGLPVDRTAADGVVGGAVEKLRAAPQLYLALTPEGTRKKVARWKSGFYRIAHGAGVPIFLVSFDYRSRTVGLGPLFEPTGDLETDLPLLMARFEAGMARYPGNY